MAAIPKAVDPAVNAAAVPTWAGRQVNQTIGTLAGTDASYGFSETQGSPANIPGGQAAPTVTGNPFSEYMDFVGEAASPRYSPPMQTGVGPTIPYEASVPQAQVAHGIDDGSTADNEYWPKPPANQYWMTDVKTPVQTTLKQYNPDGTLVMQPMGNSQVAQMKRWGDHTNLNVGVGYYIQENSRPFYNSLAATAPVQDTGMTGYHMPYGGVQQQGYNDGGIPTVYAGTPDPYVATTTAGAEAPPMGAGF